VPAHEVPDSLDANPLCSVPIQNIPNAMKDASSSTRPDDYWQRAGKIGYGRAMYRSGDVERHVLHRMWNIAVEIADELGMPRSGRILDFGCGDGAFANQVLAPLYRAIDGYDKAPAAIERARATSPGAHLTFAAADLVSFDYDTMPRYDGAFLMGILHHIKQAAPSIVRSLARRTDRMVVLEPNGDNLMRKALEMTPMYRRAGEDSFRTREIIEVFADAGWRTVVHRRCNIFPNFAPGLLYRLLAPLEMRVEASPVLSALCTVNMLGVTR